MLRPTRIIPLSQFAPTRQTLWPLSASRQRAPLLLLQALLTTFADDLSRFRALCGRVPRWDKCFDLAEGHGVAGLLHRALCDAGYILPAAERTAVDRRAAAGRLKQKGRHAGMRAVLEALDRARIQVVALKGLVLAERLYGDPSLRYSADLDLLIRPDDLEAVSAVLASLGYQDQGGPTGQYERAHSHHLTFYHADFPMVEIHFHLLVAFGATIAAAGFLARSMAYQTPEGIRCRVLMPEDEVFYLLLHAVHHEFARFCWVYDIWTFLRLHQGLDWQEVFRRAEQEGVREPIFYTVELLRCRLGLQCRLPSCPLTRQARQAVASVLLRLYDLFTLRDAPSTLVDIFFMTALCDRARGAFSTLGHHLWRITRRRLQRWLPQVVPAEWCA
jgi:hypothetical protein